MNEKINLLDVYYSYYDNEDYKNAILILKKMKIIHHNLSWVYAKIALNYYELRQYDQAIKYCTDSLRNQPKYPLPLWTLCNSLYYEKKYEESIKILNSIVKMTEFEIGKVETQLGLVWGRSLIMDSYIKMADNYYMLEKDNLAKICLVKFENIRKRKVKSYFPLSYINEMRKKIKRL